MSAEIARIYVLNESRFARERYLYVDGIRNKRNGFYCSEFSLDV